MTLDQPGAGILALLASALGIGFLSGLRLYATVFTLGMAIRWDLLHLKQHLASLAVLADTRILALAGLLAALEFLADKVPWIDSAWDSVHSVIRPVAATALAATALGEFDTATQVILALLAGTVALSTHSAKAAARLAVNHSPEPFTNVALSATEDIAAPAALWLIAAHPLVFLIFLAIFLTFVAFFGPLVYRALRLELASFAAALHTLFDARPALWVTAADFAPPAAGRRLWDTINGRLEPLPAALAQAVATRVGASPPPAALRCAPASGIPRLKRSIGYLCLAGDHVVFVTRRLFRRHLHAIALAEIRDCRWRGGLLLDSLVIETPGAALRFDVFKTPVATGPQPAPALSS